MSTLKLGTRGSQLALYQANTTASLLNTHAGIDCEIVVIKTSGDRLAEVPLSEIGGKRLFVKEIEDSLLAARSIWRCIAVRICPPFSPPRLTLGAVLPREDARDAVVLPDGRHASSVDEVKALLGPAPKIGTRQRSAHRSADRIVSECPLRANPGQSRYATAQARLGRL
jgi:hydroxymethylbilane synthase